MYYSVVSMYRAVTNASIVELLYILEALLKLVLLVSAEMPPL